MNAAQLAEHFSSADRVVHFDPCNDSFTVKSVKTLQERCRTKVFSTAKLTLKRGDDAMILFLTERYQESPSIKIESECITTRRYVDHPVQAYCRNTLLPVKRYESIVDAIKDGFNGAKIRRCVTGGAETHNDLIWKLISDPPPTKPPRHKNTSRVAGTQCDRIIARTDEIMHHAKTLSAFRISKLLGISRRSVKSIIRDNSK